MTEKNIEEQEFWVGFCGFKGKLAGIESIAGSDDTKLVYETPPIDLNNLFLYAPDIIVGIYFRYYPGGCECELTYITEAGFDTEKSWVKNETGDEGKSRELSDQALYQALLAIRAGVVAGAGATDRGS